MISKKMENALNEHLNAELYSAYLYMSMGAYFKSINLDGFANWMRIQVLEELGHVDKFYNYLCDRGGRVILESIDKPPSKWDSPLNAFEDTYKHECHVSGLINKLVQVARDENDNATYNFLQWFIEEQVEEEATAESIMNQLKLVGDNGMAILMFDRELGQRVYTPPQQSGE